MKRNFINFIQFSELRKPLINKKALNIATFLKGLILVVFLGAVFLYIQQESVNTWRVIVFFHFIVLLTGILLGAFLASIKLSLSNVVNVLYAVITRIFAVTVLLYIVFSGLMKLFNHQIAFSFWEDGTFLMFGVIMFLLIPTAFFAVGEEKSQ